jgi:hypothetical protein
VADKRKNPRILVNLPQNAQRAGSERVQRIISAESHFEIIRPAAVKPTGLGNPKGLKFYQIVALIDPLLPPQASNAKIM